MFSLPSQLLRDSFEIKWNIIQKFEISLQTLVSTASVLLTDLSDLMCRLCALGDDHRGDCCPVCDPLHAQEKFPGKTDRLKGSWNTSTVNSLILFPCTGWLTFRISRHTRLTSSGLYLSTMPVNPLAPLNRFTLMTWVRWIALKWCRYMNEPESEVHVCVAVCAQNHQPSWTRLPQVTFHLLQSAMEPLHSQRKPAPMDWNVSWVTHDGNINSADSLM